MRSSLQSAAEELQKSFSSVFGGDTDSKQQMISKDDNKKHDQTEKDSIKTAYINNHLKLYDVSAKYRESLLEGKVAGVLFKIKNDGDRSLDKIEVTVYFKDSNGVTIAEEDYNPVFVSEYNFTGDDKPLKPGYIWQMPKDKFYPAKQVPSEWKEGSIDILITDIEFSE